MITRMLIKNFQAHERLLINFDPGITTIVGPSDVGKSAIIRALRWVCTNAPGGDAFVRHGADAAVVKLEVDGHTITRRRGGDVNEYRLDDNVFKAFGRDVPDPIKNLLNMGPTSWQQQHDAPYWFSDTPGEVSRQLNTIVNLGIIDDTLAAVARTVYAAKNKLEASEGVLTDTKRETKALAWVPDFSAAVGALEVMDTEAETATAQAAKVATLLAKATKAHQARESAAGAAQAGQIATDAGTKALQLRRDADALARMVAAVGEYKANAAIEVPTAAAITAAYTDYKVATDGAKALRKLIDDIREKESILCQAETTLKQADGLVPETATCPTCGQFLSPTSTSKHDHP